MIRNIHYAHINTALTETWVSIMMLTVLLAKATVTRQECSTSL